jgi:subtilisin family serine protease
VGYHFRLKHGRREPWPRHKDSWGLPPTPALREACAAAYAAGALLVCTLSNNENRRTVKYPTACEEVIGVTAVDRHGAKSTFSNYGPLAEVAGPGGRRQPGNAASWTDEEGIYSAAGREGYQHWSGGCQAVPFVAGVAALVLSRHPSWPAETVRQVVRNTATGSGWNEYLGHGIVNARRAVEVEEASADLSLTTADVVWTAEGHRYPAEGVTGTLRVTIHNRGALDVTRAMVVAFDGEPDNRGFQLGHALFPVRGRECTTVELPVALDPGQHCIHLDRKSVV